MWPTPFDEHDLRPVSPSRPTASAPAGLPPKRHASRRQLPAERRLARMVELTTAVNNDGRKVRVAAWVQMIVPGGEDMKRRCTNGGTRRSCGWDGLTSSGPSS